MVHGVIVGIAALRNAQHHAAAALEGDLVDAACAQRHINAGQLVAIAKAAVADGLHALRQDDLRQAGIQAEGQAADGLQLAALFERDAGQIGRTVEGICADGGDVRADLHAADPGPVLGPGLRMLVGIIRHSAAAGDNESAALIQRPGDVAAAAAAGQNAVNKLSQRIGDPILHGIIMGIAALGNVQHHTGRLTEGGRVDAGHTLRDIELKESRALREAEIADDLDRLRKHKLRHRFKTGKARGIQRFQLAVFGKCNGCYIEALGQIADGSDIRSDFNAAEVGPIGRPGRNALSGILLHGAIAAKLERAVVIQDPLHRNAGETGHFHIGRLGSHIIAVLKQAGLAANCIAAVQRQAVCVEINRDGADFCASDHPVSAFKVYAAAGLAVRCPAVVLRLGCVFGVSAGGALQLVSGAVVNIGVLIVLADGGGAAGELIQHRPGAVGGHVIGRDGRLIAVGRDVHIDALEVERRDVKVEIGVIHDGVGLAAGGAADVVHRAVFVDLTVGQRRRAGVAVVVTGEVEVDPGRVARRGQVLLVDLTAAGGVGVVGGNVRHQYLPGAGALRRILNQPIGKALEAVLVGGVVQNGDIHVAALHGVPVGGDAEGALDRDGTVAAVVRLVVADNVEHIRVADAVERKQLQRIVPLVIVADVIHCVAQLDAEVILTGQLVRDAVHALESGFLLNVGQQEEAGLLLRGGHREAADIRPDGTVADAVIVRRSGGQAREGDTVHATDLVAGGVGDQAAGTLHLHSAGHVGVGGKPGHSPITAVRGVAHPGDGLAVSGRGQVVDDVIGRAGFVAHGVIAEQGDLIGAVARFIGSPQVHAALAGRQAGDVDPTVLVGIAQQHVVGVHMDTGGSLAVPDNGDGSGGGAAHHGSVRLDAVDRLHRIGVHRGRKARSILVHIADFETLGLLAAVGTLRHLHVDAAALGRRGGHVHGDGGQPVGAERRVVDGGNLQCHNALGAVIAPRTRNARGERHICDGVAAGDGNARGERGDAGKVVARDGQLPCLANRGRALRGERHAGQICLLGLHSEVARLTRDVAVAVLQVEGDGVQAVAEVHQAGGAAEVVTVILAAVQTVEVEVRRLDARGIGIRLLAVVVGNEEAKIAGAEGRAVFQLGLGAVVVDQLDGVHHGSGDILVVGTVHHAQVIQQDIALQVALVQLRAVGGIPADAAGGGHGPEQHAAVDPDQRTGILGQISLQILPAGLQALASSRAAVAEVDIGAGPALAAVGAGGDLGTEPGDRNALGNVDPYAQSGGGAVDGQVVAQAQARTVRTAQFGPVVLQLDGVVAEADDIGVCLVGIGYYRALHHAAAARVVISGHGVGRHAGKALHGGADGRIVPGVLVAAVQDHGGLHADVHGDGGRQVIAHSGDGGAAGILHVAGNGEQVAGEAAGVRIGNGPLDVTVLQVDGLRLVSSLEAQIADLVVVQVHLSGGKGQLVRALDVEHGGAHGPPAADQAHRHVAGLAGGNKGGGGAAAVYGGGGHRAHGLIADGEAHVLRQSLGGSTGEVHGVRRQGDGGAGGIVLIAGGNGSVVKLTGSRHGGYHQNGAGNTALAAAGRGVAHGDVLLTLPLGDVGGGAALVELDRRHAAESHHHLCLLGRGIAHGAGRHCAVGLEQDDRSVGLHAHAGAGIVAAVAGLGDDDLAVPHHGDQRVHGLQDLYGRALLLALAGLGLRKGRALLEDVDRAVIKRGDKGAAGVVVVHHAVHHQIAGGFAGIDVEPRSVDASHYVQSCLLFVDMGLIRGGFQGPALLLGVAVAVAGHDLCAAARGVHLHDVSNRLRVARIIVGDDDPLGNVGCNGVVLH